MVNLRGRASLTILDETVWTQAAIWRGIEERKYAKFVGV
jgi:hypothetical protein